MARRITTEQLLEAGKRFFSFFLALYLVFLLGRSVYQNYRINVYIANLEADIKHLKQENQRLANLIAYYHTETFRELEARSKLGLKKSGETVIALPENSDEPVEERKKEEPARSTSPQETPNYIKWWEYLFGET